MNARTCKNVISIDLNHIHGGVLVFRKGESTEQYPHTGCFVSTQRYPPEGFVATEGSTPEASSTVRCLTDNRKGEKLRAVSFVKIINSHNPEKHS